jgi:voltage-gated potassium channel
MRYTEFKQHISDSLDNPQSKNFFTVNATIAFLIGFSLPLTVTQVIPPLHIYEPMFHWTHWPTNIIFTLEYLVRFFAAEKRARYVLSPFGLIDLISVLPPYLGLGNFEFVKAARFIRFARLSRFADFINLSKLVPPEKK